MSKRPLRVLIICTRSLWIAVLVQTMCPSLAQTNSKRYSSPKLIDKIQVFGGLSMNFPNDKGYDDYVYIASDKRTTYESSAESGYVLGISAIQSMKRFELQGRISFEQRQYSEANSYYELNGDLHGQSFTLQKYDYLTFSLVPTYFLSASRRFHLFAGFCYAHLSRAFAYSQSYVNGQYDSAIINTFDGSKKHIVDAIAGVGYCLPIGEKFRCIVRCQGNYGLNNTEQQNMFKLSINSLSMSMAVEYLR
jgi:hypothetical protein